MASITARSSSSTMPPAARARKKTSLLSLRSSKLASRIAGAPPPSALPASPSSPYDASVHRGAGGSTRDRYPVAALFTQPSQSSSSISDTSSAEEDAPRDNERSRERAKARGTNGTFNAMERIDFWLEREQAQPAKTQPRTRGAKSKPAPVADQFAWDEAPYLPSALRVSGSSTLTGSETPPRTPDDTFSSFALGRAAVMVAAPVPGVETMDALVDGMNGVGGDELFMGKNRMARERTTRTAKEPLFHPLYQPPLPTPPPGVVLGRHPSPAPQLSSDDDDDGRLGASRQKRRARRPHSSRTPSTATITMSSSAAAHAGSSSRAQDHPSSIDDIIKKHVQPKAKTPVPTISEIIKKHTSPAAPSPTPGRGRASLSRSSSSYATSNARLSWPDGRARASAEVGADDTDQVSRSSVDSITAEVQESLLTHIKSSSPPPNLQHARSFPRRPQSVVSDTRPSGLSVRSREPSVYSSSAASHSYSQNASPMELTFHTANGRASSHSQTIAAYLRSARLTTLVKLTRSPHASRDHPLTVSLCDLGSRTGHPLVIFLGLGCVRHILGLYDEMAECLGLRLIAVDRWGMGRTTEARSKFARGIPEWASAVEEVLDRLGIDQCSVMAHSAGAPYALSFASRVPHRIRGDVCLLAPWVGGGEGAGYKWLKYVPNGILKTAQAAEWKIQTWMIGKPPKMLFEGIGYDVRAPLSSASFAGQEPESPNSPNSWAEHSEATILPGSQSHDSPSHYPESIVPRPSMSSSFSDFDDLRDFNGRFDSSRSTLGIRASTGSGPSRSRTLSSVNERKSPTQSPRPPRKASKGFLGRFRQASHPSSPPPEPKSPQTPSLGGRRLRALRSIGSLRTSKTASKNGAGSASMQNLRTPRQLTLDVGNKSDNVDWQVNLSPNSESSSTPVRTPTSQVAPPASQPPATSSYSLNTSSGYRQGGGRRSFSLNASPAPSLRIQSQSPSPNAPKIPPAPESPGLSYQVALANALIAASHAEASKGVHSDLLQILNHDGRSWGFSYTTFPHTVRVWYGDKDERIAENAVRWMEKNMGEDRCRVKVVKGADHALMYNSGTVIEVLEQIHDSWL